MWILGLKGLTKRARVIGPKTLIVCWAFDILALSSLAEALVFQL